MDFRSLVPSTSSAKLQLKIGVTSILHTWTQKLEYHPHIHCIVPSGGLSLDGQSWIPGRADYLFPISVLQRVFRGKLIDFLNRAVESGALSLPKKNERALLISAAAQKDWVVYAKPTMGSPEAALRYLSGYTHRIAISNHRILPWAGVLPLSGSQGQQSAEGFQLAPR